MTYDARTRDRHRLAVAATTGVATVASLTATGFLAGQLSRQAAEAEAEQQQPSAQAQAVGRPPRRAHRDVPTEPRLRERPTRVRVTTRYVEGAGGGTVDQDTSSGSTRSGPAPAPAPAPDPAPAPAPEPDPPPAPSSGS